MTRIEELRRKKGFTQQGVYARTGIDQSDYSRIERELRDPTIQQSRILAELFDTSIDYLVGFTDDPRPYRRSEKK